MARTFGNPRRQGTGAHARARAPFARPPADVARAVQRSARGETSTEDLLTLQQSFGNKAVGSMLSRAVVVPSALAAVQRWPWDDWGGSKGGGGAGGADAKGGAGGDSGPKGGVGGAEAKGAGGVPHGDMPWGKMWKMYEGIKEDRKMLDDWPPSAVLDGEDEREEEPWTAY